MRHRKAGRQFGRNTAHRRAMFRALTANLVAHERIETTDAKAKELRRVTERLITRAIRLGEVAYTPHDKLSLADRARRIAVQRQMSRFLRRFAVVPDGQDSKKVDLVEKVFLDLAKRFKDRPGGYTRIIKLGRRRGDNAPMSLIEFVDFAAPVKEAKPKAGSKKPKAEAETKAETKTEPAETAAEQPAEEGTTEAPQAETKPKAKAKAKPDEALEKPKAKAKSKSTKPPKEEKSEE